MIRTGKVIQAEGNILEVCFSRMEACESCGMCGSGRDDARVKINGNAHEGDMVDVEMPDARVLKASAVTYLVPLAGLIAGLALGTGISPTDEIKTVTVGFAGLFLGLGIIKRLDRKMGRLEKWQPRIVAVYPGQGTDQQTAVETGATGRDEGEEAQSL